MRLLVRLSARRSSVYDTSYHHKLRGRIWRGLQDSPYSTEHDADDPVGISFSNVFPWGDFEAGDSRCLLIASAREEPLAYIAADLLDSRELNIGEMPFTIDSVEEIYTDVGEPGSTGTLRTETGVFAKVPPQFYDSLGLSPESSDVYWNPEYTIEPFNNYVETQIERNHARFGHPDVVGPCETEQPLFDEYNLLKTFSLPVTVTSGVELTLVLSKWEFTYTVRDEAHREHLNLALDVGVGGRTGLGLGFMNKVEVE